MPYAVYGSPGTPATAAPDPWSPLDITWTGWDGRRWSLAGTDPEKSIRLQQGVRGFTFPPIEEHVSESPARRGQEFQDHRELAREVFWPLMVHHGTGSKEWLAWDALFRRSLRFNRPGMWSVRQPESGETRSVMLRLRGDGDPPWYASPGLLGWGTYEYTLVADQPLWSGAPILSPRWTLGDPVDFTGPEDAAPDYYVSEAATSESATMTNPSDVGVWPTFTFRDQLNAGSEVSVNGFRIGVPFALELGDLLTISTETGGARLNGERVGHLLNPREFEPIPDGEEVEIGISIAGTGSVQASITPLYYAAW
ncbi:hypothetical protein [Isoptericola sp. NPDC056605]|uniref:hypothetical protein n=1 Tax=Isoptericola sp. NPDC056605 TaxID=3345876 RepID=UPI0036CF90ED